jgi:hypothetical protein
MEPPSTMMNSSGFLVCLSNALSRSLIVDSSFLTVQIREILELDKNYHPEDDYDDDNNFLPIAIYSITQV